MTLFSLFKNTLLLTNLLLPLATVQATAGRTLVIYTDNHGEKTVKEENNDTQVHVSPADLNNDGPSTTVDIRGSGFIRQQEEDSSPQSNGLIRIDDEYLMPDQQ